MSFVKYSSLENHTNSKFLSKIFDLIMDKPNLEFVAREKIHGTNFSIIITKDEIQPAKRTGFIGELEKFFGYEDLMIKYKNQFVQIQEQLKEQKDKYVSIQIFGEYAGGNIQKEVDYGEKELYVFDILTTKQDGEPEYWPDASVELFCIKNKLKIAPLIKRGTLEELLKLPVEFESVVNEFDALYESHPTQAMITTWEQHEPKENVSEGLVIKPNKPLFLNGGSRVAIKYKTDAFKEKGKGKAPKIPVPLSENDKELLLKFSEYVTKPRIKNVVSHIGEITAKDFGKVLGLTMRDIFVEAEREGVVIDVAEAPSKTKAELQKMVSVEIREIWLDLIN